MSDTKPIEPPWWLSGDHLCEHCMHEYSVEVGYYCIDCDSPVCPLCVVEIREHSRIVCPNCAKVQDPAE